jgi:hypothetical protein
LEIEMLRFLVDDAAERRCQRGASDAGGERSVVDDADHLGHGERHHLGAEPEHPPTRRERAVRPMRGLQLAAESTRA